jgi:glyoxylase-like metal-dependent hydrolase (beta-lactamase superfamily II)
LIEDVFLFFGDLLFTGDYVNKEDYSLELSFYYDSLKDLIALTSSWEDEFIIFPTVFYYSEC